MLQGQNIDASPLLMLQGYLAHKYHKNPPPLLGSPFSLSPTVGSQEGVVSYE